jgi:hypothetical protein
VHIGELLHLHAMTSAPWFAQTADTLRTDYPRTAAGQVEFGAGKVLGYRFQADGSVLSTKAVTLARPSSAPADQRLRVRGRGVHYRITGGLLAGWWVPEVAGKSVMGGRYGSLTYFAPRRVVLAAGAHTAYTFTTAGAVATRLTKSLSRSSSASFTASAYINARLHVRVASGMFAGYWLPVSSATALQ